MKVAFIVNLFPQLSETFILNQITGLIDSGHEVDIFAQSQGSSSKVHSNIEKYNLIDRTFYFQSPPSNKIKRIIRGIGIIVKYIHRRPLTLIRSLNALKYWEKAISLDLLYKIIPFLDKGSYDITHCHFGPNGNLGILLRDIGAIKSKVITSFHGYDVNRYPTMHGKDIYFELFNKADLITANSNFTKYKVIELGCDKDKIIKLPVGLNTSLFVFKERKLAAGAKIKVLTVARLTEKKGIKYSIMAVAEVLKKFPNIKYKIVGDGHLRSELTKLINQLGVEKEVELVGWKNQEEIQQYYSEAHIFVLSSVTARDGDCEGQGLVLQEAQAMGIPVISTLHNGIPESLIDGESGFLVPERDVNALVERLDYLIAHSDKWFAMGCSGRKFVEEHFDIEQLNRKLEEIYRGLLN